jgi:hypothetical protein
LNGCCFAHSGAGSGDDGDAVFESAAHGFPLELFFM